MRNIFLTIILINLCSTVAGQQIAKKNLDKPNIVLILTDDQGWGDVAVHGNPYLDTPHLDFLATEGAEFNYFYVDPVCAPSRGALLTGRYSFRTGAVGVSHGWENLPTEEITVAELLKDQGYATACFGKWHNGRHYDQHPLRQGFDTFFGFRSGGLGDYFDPILEYNDRESVPTQGYVADILTDSAIAFIERHQQEPFFCYLPYNTPHTPFQVPDQYFIKYKNQGLNDPVASIYSMVENIDDNVGRLLDALENRHLLENTLIIFLTDNGPIGKEGERYNGNLRGNKGSLYEGGTRVPAFFYWKRTIQPATTINSLAAHVDVLPTLVDLAGGSLPPNVLLDGLSLVPLLKSTDADTLEREIFAMQQVSPRADYVMKHQIRATLRKSQYRLMKDAQQYELYDLGRDSQQANDYYEVEDAQSERLVNAMHHYLNPLPDTALTRSPSPIGQPTAHRHTLFVDEAKLGSGVSYYKEFGFNSDWVTDFDSLGESFWWNIDPVNTQKYRVYVRYTSPQSGIKLQISSGQDKLTGAIQEAFDPDFFRVPDRFEAGGKSSVRKPWKDTFLGELTINQHDEKLTVTFVDNQKNGSVDIRAVILEPI